MVQFMSLVHNSEQLLVVTSSASLLDIMCSQKVTGFLCFREMSQAVGQDRDLLTVPPTPAAFSVKVKNSFGN